MTIAHELWQKKESPLWLLQASRSCAQYPNPENISNTDVNAYVAQFSHGILPDITDPKFLEKIHPGHKALFELLAKEANAYFGVFFDRHAEPYDSYTGELVKQFNDSYGSAHSINLKNYQINESRHVIGNMVVAVAIAAIRDMALIEDLYRNGKLNDAERAFGLDTINHQMDRVGLNGIDRLFESKPDLEEMVKSDTRSINVGHIGRHAKWDTMTRAACYNAESRKINESGLPNSFLTKLRQQIITPDFQETEELKDNFLLVHTHDLTEPSAEMREKFKGNGIMSGFSSEMDERRQIEMLKTISADMSRGSYNSVDGYLNFLIHDGIAINHPKRSKFVESLHEAIKKGSGPGVEILPSDTYVDARNITPEVSNRSPNLLSDLTGSESDKQQPNADAPEVSDLDGQRKLGKGSDSVETDADSDPKDKPAAEAAPKKSNTGAIIATAGGTAALAGLLLAGGDKKRSGADVKDYNHPHQEKNDVGKALAIAGAATVAIGGIVMLTRKPNFLYKPLRELFEKLGGGLGRS